MNLPFFIARRYFLSGKKKNFINVISIISMIVVAIGTMCLIIALSVFNGLEGLLRSMYGNFDPDIVITPATGKSFTHDPNLIHTIRSVPGVLGVTEVIEDNVLVQYKEAQRLVRMKGVSRDFDEYSGIRNVMVAGDFPLVRDSIGYALIGRGVQYDLSLSLSNDFYTLQMYYPKDIGPGVVNPTKMYNLQNIMPGGIFAIEKSYDDNYIFIPIEHAKDLLDYGNKLTGYDLYLDEGTDYSAIKVRIQNLLGANFLVRLGEELHSDLYKVLKIEKLFVFIILVSIIGIASINIFFSLTMLVIEKKKDISVLFAQGASQALVQRIFLFEGCIVAFTGAGVGLILGVGLSLAQQYYGLIGMGMESAVINSYPVKIESVDVLYSVLAIVTITLLASINPAIKASRSFSVDTLQ
ncbi:MAG: ABC transporter permease [Ekhidna sp.]|nr:ABC transporter permease [Ekhidna sp.]